MAATATSKTNKKTKTPKLSVPKDATYATGRRKEASARVWIFPGKGQITVNGRTFDDYFPRDILRIVATQPLVTTETLSKFDIFCTVKGSGISEISQICCITSSLIKPPYATALRSALFKAAIAITFNLD